MDKRVKNEEEELNFRDFITNTDKKGVKSQLMVIIKKSLDIIDADVVRRRAKLKQLLDSETSVLEEEFALKVNSAIESGIQKRRDMLMNIDVDDKLEEAKFELHKRHQCQINRSHDIRDALARKGNIDWKNCLDAQVAENERKKAKEIALENYWHEVHKIGLAKFDKVQCHLECIQKDTRDQRNFVLGKQKEDKEIVRERERQQKIEEGKKVDNLIRQLQLEEIDTECDAKMARKKKMREESLKEMERRCFEKQAEREREANEFREHCKELQRLEREEMLANHEHKLFTRRQFDQYTAFNRGVRQIKAAIERDALERTEEVKRVYDCTKDPRLRDKSEAEALKKQYFIDLKKQMCEELDRKIIEEKDRRDCGITYNPFDRSDPPCEEIREKQIKYKEALDAQIKMDKEVHAKIEEEYLKSLPKPPDDPQEIAILVKKCEFERFDFLPPHDNWLPIARDKTKYVGKPASEPFVFTSDGKDRCCRTKGFYEPKGGIVCPPWMKRCHF